MVNGEHNRTAFVIKSVFYWFSAIINVLEFGTKRDVEVRYKIELT